MSEHGTRRWASLGGRPRTRASLAALGACVGGFVAGLVGILLLNVVLTPAVRDTAVFAVVGGNLIQVGFAAFALLYLLRRGDYGRYVRVRVPTLEDVAWIVAIPFLLLAGGAVVTPILTALGLPEPTPGGGTLDLAGRPLLWLVAFVGLYLFAAPAEELVYRGLVQGELRRAFGVIGVVLGGALLFGLLHLLVGLLTPAVPLGGSLHWGIAAVVPGLVWGYAYERTGNLVVTAVTHAMSWTIPFQAVLPFL